MRKAFMAFMLSTAFSASGASAESLADAMIAAYRHSNLMDQYQALLRAADEDVATAVASLRPVLAFVAQAGSESVEQEPFSDPATSIALTADLILWDYGRGQLAVEAAKQAVLATREQLVQVEQQVLLAAVQAYIEVRVREEVVSIRQNNVRLLEQELQATQDRFDVGEVTRTDLALAESQLASARAGLSTANGDLLVARESYKAATGAYPGQLDRTPPMPAMPKSQQEAVSVALRTHPDVLQAQRQVTLADVNVSRAAAEMGPNLTARATVATAPSTKSEFVDGEIVSSDYLNDTNNITVTYSQTIYAGGGISSAYRAALANKEAAQSNLLQTGVNVTQDVGNSWSSLSVSAASIEATIQQVNAAQIAFDGMKEEANLGSRTTIDVLDAEQDLLDANFARLEAEATRYVAAYKLLYSMGLLTADHLQLGIPTYDPAVYYNAVRNAPVTSPQGKKLDRILKSLNPGG